MPYEASPAGWFRCKRLVEFRDTDAAGIAHFSAFFFWMESAEHALLRHCGLKVVDRAPEDAEELRHLVPAASDKNEIEVSWPRVSVTADYQAAVRFGEELEIAVGVADIGHASVTYGFKFERAGRLVAIGKVVAVRCLMRRGEKPLPVKIPTGVASRLERHRLPAGVFSAPSA